MGDLSEGSHLNWGVHMTDGSCSHILYLWESYMSSSSLGDVGCSGIHHSHWVQ